MINLKVVVYDLEMVCWGDRGGVGEIIEIGAVLVDLEKEVIVKKASVLVKPDEPLSDFCTSLTGISQKMVDREGVSLPEAVRRISKKVSLRSHPCFAWGRDVSTICREFDSHGIKFDVANFHNLAVFIRMMYGQSRGLGLHEVCREFGVDVIEPAHRALPDAETTAMLVIKLFGKTGELALSLEQ